MRQGGRGFPNRRQKMGLMSTPPFDPCHKQAEVFNMNRSWMLLRPTTLRCLQAGSQFMPTERLECLHEREEYHDIVMSTKRDLGYRLHMSNESHLESKRVIPRESS